MYCTGGRRNSIRSAIAIPNAVMCSSAATIQAVGPVRVDRVSNSG
jgi:hypothetical protein